MLGCVISISWFLFFPYSPTTLKYDMVQTTVSELLLVQI